MTKPASTSKKPRKQHTSEFRNEALKLAEHIGVADAARDEENIRPPSWPFSKRPRHTSRSV